MMDCLIVEDSKIQRLAITELVSRFDFLNIVGECEDAVDAYNFLKKTKVDMIFLDVEMPKMSGIELLRTLDNRPLIIMITSSKEYAIEAFELNVVDYVMKPVRAERFIKAIEKARDLFENTKNKGVVADKDFLFAREDGILRKIKNSEIYFIKALGDYVSINLVDKKHTIHATLKSLEEKLPPDSFMRVHRSYILALDKIDTIEGHTAYLRHHRIPVGDNFYSDLVKKINLI